MGIVVEKGTRSLETLAQLADSTAQPESFESLASMIRSISEASKNLLNLHKQKSEVLNPQAHKSDMSVLITTNMITKQLPSTARNRLLNKQDGELIEGEVENESE